MRGQAMTDTAETREQRWTRLAAPNCCRRCHFTFAAPITGDPHQTCAACTQLNDAGHTGPWVPTVGWAINYLMHHLPEVML